MVHGFHLRICRFNHSPANHQNQLYPLSDHMSQERKLFDHPFSWPNIGAIEARGGHRVGGRATLHSKELVANQIWGDFFTVEQCWKWEITWNECKKSLNFSSAKARSKPRNTTPLNLKGLKHGPIDVFVGSLHALASRKAKEGIFYHLFWVQKHWVNIGIPCSDDYFPTPRFRHTPISIVFFRLGFEAC